ncbi:MAG TPA: hypothetical protein VGK73_33185 [Polyangiaceae bacterium]
MMEKTGCFRGYLALFWLSGACASPAAAGAGPFREGRLPAALAALRARESELTDLPPAGRARYALSRGLAELGMGNARAASAWLSEAKRADAADPACFAASERGQLLAAWRSLGRMPGETPASSSAVLARSDHDRRGRP